MTEASINGDLDSRAVMHGADMGWQASPSGTVWRKRFHLVGGGESGQVTSLVRYQPLSSFPAHDHPEGEEILVLEGIFSDEHGEYPAGSYLLNPEGFRHAPFSTEGCLLFVKLRQYPGQKRAHVSLRTAEMVWQDDSGGGERKALFGDASFPDRMQLERWPPGQRAETAYGGGAEIFVLQGAFADEAGCYRQYSWLRLPPGARHRPATSQGCELYVKLGGQAILRGA